MGNVRRPLRRARTRWEEIAWDEALDEVGSRLREIRAAHGKDAIGTYIGNPTGHDFGAMLYTAFFIQVLGTERVFTGATVDQYPKNVTCRKPGVNVNRLADELLLDELSGTSVLNGIPVEIEPVSAAS